MFRILTLSAVLVLSSAGCVSGPSIGLPPVQQPEQRQPVIVAPQPLPKPFVLERNPRAGDSFRVRFYAEDIRWSRQVGSNTISGKAHAPLISGAIATCAGDWGYAIPVGHYSTARMYDMYGSIEAGELSGKAPPADPTFIEMVFKSRCNDQGIFQIPFLADGSYYVVSRLSWYDYKQGEEQSVGLMQRVTVSNGEHVGVLFSPY